MVYAHLFLTHFHRWLQGKGHLCELVGTFITEEMYQEGLESPDTVHPQLFWNAITDVEVLPVVGLKNLFVGMLSVLSCNRC